MSWLVNPEEDEDEAVLFNAEEDDFLDYEDNPKRKRRKGSRKGKKAKSGKPRRHKRRKGGRKAKKAVAPAAPKKRRKRRAKKAGRRKKRRARKVIKFVEAPKKTRRHRRRKASKKKAVRKHKKRRKSKKAKTMAFESNPRKKRRSRRKHYASNPVKRKHRRKKLRWKAKAWKSNPFASIKGIPAWMKLPSKNEIGKGWGAAKNIGFGILGVVDTGLIGKGVEMAIMKFAPTIPEPGVDVIRIASKFAAGTAISYGIQKFGKNTTWAKFHQTGVYIGVIADTVFTVAKYLIRQFGGTRYKLPAPIKMPLSVKGIAMNAFGLGSLGDLLEERKLVSALETDGLVVAGNEMGEVCLANATTGDIIISGPADSMAPVVQAVQGVAFYTGDTDDDSESGLGEDITVES
jgi:hypothetical protein